MGYVGIEKQKYVSDRENFSIRSIKERGKLVDI
jgi:hypothetical protein